MASITKTRTAIVNTLRGTVRRCKIPGEAL